jgi:hypothetical protein
VRSIVVVVILTLATAAHAACPSGRALATVADAAFPADMRGNATLDSATCTAVRSHAGTRWLLELDTGAAGLLIAVVSPSGKVVWTCCGVGGGAIVDATAADLDGDGADELVITTRDATNARAVGVQSIDGKQGDSIALAPGEQWRVGKPSSANAGRAASSTWSEIEIHDAAGNAQHYRWAHAVLEHS